MVQTTQKETVLAIIVTYNSEPSFEENLKTLIPQVGEVLLVDNSNEDASQQYIQHIALSNSSVTLRQNTTNIGLAAAQNIGIAYAQMHHYSWVLLMDDDSLPQSDMVAQLMDAYVSHPNNERVKIITPQIFDLNTRAPHKVLCKKGAWRLHSKVATTPATLWIALASGMLIPIKHFKNIGAMNEKLFIDEIDTEFCLRTIAADQIVLHAPQAHLFHQIGEASQHSLGIKKVTTWNHSPLRKFYIFRNRIWLWKQYWSTTPRFILYEMGSTFKLFLLILLFETNKKEKLSQSLKGLWEGVWMK